MDDQIKRHRISTLKRRLCAIAFAHRIQGLPMPTDASVVKLAVRRAARQKASRPQQKRGLTYAIRAALITACPDCLQGRRNAALLSVDTIRSVAARSCQPCCSSKSDSMLTALEAF